MQITVAWFFKRSKAMPKRLDLSAKSWIWLWGLRDPFDPPSISPSPKVPPALAAFLSCSSAPNISQWCRSMQCTEKISAFKLSLKKTKNKTFAVFCSVLFFWRSFYGAIRENIFMLCFPQIICKNMFFFCVCLNWKVPKKRKKNRTMIELDQDNSIQF